MTILLDWKIPDWLFPPFFDQKRFVADKTQVTKLNPSTCLFLLNFSVFESFTFASYTRDLKKKKNYKKLQYTSKKS